MKILNRSLRFLILFVLTPFAVEVHFSGSVFDKTTLAKLKSAKVELAVAKLSTVTDSLGNFTFGTITGIHSNPKGNNFLSHRDLNSSGNGDLGFSVFENKMEFESAQNQKIQLSLLDLSGKVISEIFSGNISKGENSFSLSEKIQRQMNHSRKRIILKTETNKNVTYFTIQKLADQSFFIS